MALAVIGGIGVLLSRLIKAGVSRQRESLADASAVQFTREPEGLAGALKKIGGYSARIVSVDTEEVAHMLFERGTRPFSGWFATHPPLLERIRALDPGFDPRDLPAPSPLPADRRVDTVQGASAAGLVAAAAPTASPLERAGEIAAPAGRALREAVPDEVYHATRSHDSSLLVAVALALSSDEPTRRQQLAIVERQLGATRADLARRLFDEIAPSRRIAPAGARARLADTAAAAARAARLSLGASGARPRAREDSAAVRLRLGPRAQDVSERLAGYGARNRARGARRARGATARFALGRARPAGQRRSVRQ